jgi:hypothetical protein
LPIVDPKTGETHYVDVSKVGRLSLPSLSFMDMINQEVDEISFRFYETRGEIHLAGTFYGSIEHIIIPLDNLEQVFYDLVISRSFCTLEEHSLIKEYMQVVSQRLLSKESHIYLPLGKVHLYDQGVGFIIDREKDTHIGTFEHLEVFPKQRKDVTFTLKDVYIYPSLLGEFAHNQDTQRYVCVYYCPDNKASYIITSDKFIVENEVITLPYGRMEAKEFHPQSGSYYDSLVERAIQQRKQAKDKEELITLRSELFADTRQTIKKQMIYQQYADIEL